MKKLLLTLTLLFLSFSTSIRAKATSLDESALTLDVLETLTWEELESAVSSSKEDDYVLKVIHYLNAERENKYYICVGIGGIHLEEVNFERLIQKVQKVVNIYNLSHGVQVEIKPLSLNKLCGQIHLLSTNLELLLKVDTIGQVVHLSQEEITYWESSQNFGSGKSGTLKNSDDLNVIVTGVSYLSENGNVVSSDVRISDSKPIDIGKTHMFHISSIDGQDLGWVNPSDLTL